MAELRLKNEFHTPSAPAFIGEFEVTDEELTEIYPDYPDLREEHGEEMPIYELLEEPDGEIIEKVLANRDGLYDVIFMEDGNGRFIIREHEVVE